ncbi:MAG: tRNA (5-methylaminomethyl-2-thiouridine)(34)-methyltransferase MnmD [Flavisolibacter sp.]
MKLQLDWFGTFDKLCQFFVFGKMGDVVHKRHEDKRKNYRKNWNFTEVERSLVITADGSHSVSVPNLNVTYHSVYGAIQESMHVYIDAGLRYLLGEQSFQQLRILEMGFGTGLNAFLTAIEAENLNQKIHYTTVEQFPLEVNMVASLNHPAHLSNRQVFDRIHECKWGEDVWLSEHFTLQKENVSLQDFATSEPFHLIYYDAFAPAAQPELWTREIFEKLFRLLHHNGRLVTYCSKGDVRRAMQAAGFTIEKLPGPPRKREILRAIKT